MKYNYATDLAAGACPGCGQAVVLFHHVRLTAGEERKNVTVLDSIFCRDCVERMNEVDDHAAVLPASLDDRSKFHLAQRDSDGG